MRAWRPFYLRPKFLFAALAILVLLVALQFASGLLRRIPKVDAEEAKALIAQMDKPLVLGVVVPDNVMTRGMNKIMERLAEQTGDTVRYAQIEAEEAAALDVHDAPVVLVFDKGKLRGTRPVIESKEELAAVLKY